VKQLLTAVAAAALVAVSLTAVAGARPDAVPTKKAGVLTVGMAPPAVGFVVGTVRGNKILNPRGYEVDLTKAIAKELGIAKVEYLNVPWAGLFAPGRKQFDYAMEEATITAQRKQSVDFSRSYFDANQGVLVSKQTTPPKSLADLKRLQTCAQTDTTGLDYVKTKLKPSKAPLIYQTTTAAFTAVEIGRCQAFVMDVPIVASQKKAKPSAYGPIAGQIVTKEQYGAVFEKGSKLRPHVDRAIAKLTANGTVGRLQQRWFAIDTKSLPVLK
jgi:polar amino acid transport system substrate-binding protein